MNWIVRYKCPNALLLHCCLALFVLLPGRVVTAAILDPSEITERSNDRADILSIRHRASATEPETEKLRASKTSSEQAGLLRIYRSNVLKKTYQHITYPASAIDKNHEGDVVLKVTVDRLGKVKKVDYETRANYNSLNKAAKKALQRAKPFPAVPARLRGETFELLMPIRFRLQS